MLLLFQHYTSVLTALQGAIDDREDSGGLVTLEAIKSLSIAIEKIPIEYVHSNLTNIALCIRPYFEKVIIFIIHVIA